MYYPVGVNLDSNLSTIKKMSEAIELLQLEYYPNVHQIYLFGQGSSGAIIAGIVSSLIMERTELNVYIYHISKDGESPHRSGTAPMIESGVMTVVIDDIVDTGATVQRITEKILERNPGRIIDTLCVSGGVRALKPSIRKHYRFALISEGYHSGNEDDK
jgi:orotate phosphoribosyltransferase-like protein